MYRCDAGISILYRDDIYRAGKPFIDHRFSVITVSFRSVTHVDRREELFIFSVA